MTRWYNEYVLKAGLVTKKGKPATVTEACVKYNLTLPEVMQVWYLARHGVEAWKNRFGYSILRYRPSVRDAVWCGDGTKVNLYYATPAGMAAALNVYSIVDGHSGYWLGWDISETEDAGSVQRAMRMAVERSGYRMPFQMQYDGDSANSFYKRLDILHFPAMPNNGQSKIIERHFKTLQEGFMRSADEFSGMNITARSLDSKVNKDHVDYLKKNHLLKSRAEAIRMQEHFFHLMNNTPGEDGKSPKQRYFESQNPEAPHVTQWDWVNMFWNWNERPNTYTKDGLIWEENKVKKYYEVAAGYEFDFRNDTLPSDYTPDIDFLSKYVRQEFWVRFDPHNRSRIALYKEEAGGSKRFVAWAVEAERMPYAVQDYTEGSRTNINKRLEVKKELKRKAEHSRQVAADFGDSEEILKLGHRWFNKETLHAAEMDMYCGDSAETPAPAASSPVSEQSKKERKEYLKQRVNQFSQEL